MRRVKMAVWPALSAFIIVSGPGCSEREKSLTIVFSSDMVGEIRSCGCAQRDFGGLGRRATFLATARKSADDLVLFEAGDFFGLDLNYGRQKADLTVQALSYMDYDGIVPGEKDLALGLDYLVERVEALGLPVVAANLIDTETNAPVFPPNRILVTSGGLKIGVIGVLSPRLEMPRQAPPDRLRITNPQRALDRELAKLAGAVDLVVVLAHMPRKDAIRLAQQTPEIDIIVDGHDARPLRKTQKFGNAYVLSTTVRGQYMGVAYATLGAENELAGLEMRLEPLGPRYTDDEAIVKLFRAYDLTIANEEKSLLASAIPPKEHAKNRFPGAEGCKSCHAEIHAQWEGTRHAHAFDVLEGQGRQFDRDCVPCHTTGFYEIGGFLSVLDTPELAGVQCEACHGNGSLHSRNPPVKTTGKAKTVCTTCHTSDQTPDFTFEAYWARVAH